MKKIISTLTIVFILITSVVFTQAQSTFEINTEQLSQGIVGVQYNAITNLRIKVLITKGSESYNYDLLSTEMEYFPLQLGNGAYTVRILENVSGTRYRVLFTRNVTLKTEDENVVFLQSVQNVNWSDEMEAIKKANELTKNIKNTQKKLDAIYQYVVRRMRYDHEKISSLGNVYIPCAEETFKTEKGICYDYSALFASMLRSQDIPTKLVMGYTDNVEEYHAWNEVYIDGEWKVIDTTYDSVMRDYGKNSKMVKNADQYRVSKVY